MYSSSGVMALNGNERESFSVYTTTYLIIIALGRENGK